MKRVQKIVVSLVLCVFYLTHTSYQFDNIYSGIRLRPGATFAVTNQIAGFNGSLIRLASGSITGSAIIFQDGIFEDGGNQLRMAANLATGNSLILTGNDVVRGQYGQILQAVSVSGTNNLIEGQSQFTTPITMQDQNTTLSVALESTLSTSIVMNGGTLLLTNDLQFSDGYILTVSGVVQGNGRAVKTGMGPLDWSANLLWKDQSRLALGACRTSLSSTFTFQGSTAINGNGNILDLSSGGQLIIDKDSSLCLSDVVLKGIGNNTGNIVFTSPSSRLQLSNVNLEFLQTFSTSLGGVLVNGPVTAVVKSNNWVFDQTASMTVNGQVLVVDQAGALTSGSIVFGTPQQNYLSLLNTGTIRYAGSNSSSSFDPTMLQMQITNLQTSTGDLQIQVDVNASMISMLKTSTGALQIQIDGVATSTGGLQSSLNNVITSTGYLQTQINNIITSTGSQLSLITALQTSTGLLQTQINNVATSTGVLQTQISNVATSTGAIATLQAADESMISMLKTSTGALQTQINNVATSTGVLQASLSSVITSTGYLQTQINNIITSTGSQLSLITALQTSTGYLQTQITNVATSTGAIAAQQVIDENMISMLKTSTGLLQIQLNSVSTSTGLLQTQINNVATSTGSILSQVTTTTNNLQTQISNVATSTGAIAALQAADASMISMLKTSTGELQTQINNVATSTGTLQASLNSVITSTGYLQTQINNIMTSTGSQLGLITALQTSTGYLQTQITNVATSTGAIAAQQIIDENMISMLKTSTGLLQVQINDVATSTGSLLSQLTTTTNNLQAQISTNASMIDMLKTSTGALQIQIDGVATSTGTLQTTLNSVITSTGYLQTQINNIMTSTGSQLSLITALQTSTGYLQTQITNVATSTGAIAAQQVIDESMISMLKTSTGELQVQTNDVATSTGSLLSQLTTTTNNLQAQIRTNASMIDMLKTSTGVLQIQVNDLMTSTGIQQNMINMLKTSTGMLQTEIDALQSSTGYLQRQIDTLEVTSSVTAFINYLMMLEDQIDSLNSTTVFLQQENTANTTMISMLKTSTGYLQLQIDELNITVSQQGDLIDMLQISTGLLQMEIDSSNSMISMLKTSTGFLQEEINELIAVTGTGMIPVVGDLCLTLSMLPSEYEVVIFNFVQPAATKNGYSRLIVDPMCYGNNGVLPIAKNSKVIVTGDGVLEMRDGVIIEFNGSAFDPTKSDWPTFLLDDGVIMRLDLGATVTIGGAIGACLDVCPVTPTVICATGGGCFVVQDGSQVLLDQESHLIFGQSRTNDLVVHFDDVSDLVVNDPHALVSFHLARFEIEFSNASGLSILDGTIELNTLYGQSSKGVVEILRFMQGSSLQIRRFGAQSAKLRLAPNCNDALTNFDNDTGIMYGGGNIEFINFDNAGNVTVDTILLLQNFNQFFLTAPLLEIYMNLTYLFFDRELEESPDATILALMGTEPIGSEGNLAAYLPSLSVDPNARSGAVIQLEQADHDVRYDIDALGRFSVITGFDGFNRPFSIFDGNPTTRTSS